MVETAVIMGEPATPSTGVVQIFERHASKLTLGQVTTIPQVLDVVRQNLEEDDWRVSTGARSKGGVLVGRTPRREVLAEALHPDGAVLWVELGRAWTNFGFLHHAIEAAMVPEVTDVVIAVRQRWNSQYTYDRCRDYLLDFRESGMPLSYRSLTLVGF